MAETNGQVARTRVAGKAIDGPADGDKGSNGKRIRTAPTTASPTKTARVTTAPVKAGAAEKGPEKVTSTTHVNVALPFAKLEVHEPSAHLLALTILVQDLAELLARTAPGTEADALLSRAERLAAEIR